jgi:hypothetical protein
MNASIEVTKGLTSKLACFKRFMILSNYLFEFERI